MTSNPGLVRSAARVNGLRAAAAIALSGCLLLLLRTGPRQAGWDPLAHFLLAAAVVILLSHLIGLGVTRLWQPLIVGEIIAGLVLGPSLFGAVWASGSHWLFDPATMSSLDTAAQLGLVTFMFVLGCEPRCATGGAGLLTMARALALAMLVPAAGGTAVALGFSDLTGSAGGRAGNIAFIGLAISITALPVLARIVSDLHMLDTTVGRFALHTAALGDGIAWMVLAIVLATVSGTGTLGILQRLAAAATLVLLMVGCVRPALAHLLRRSASGGGRHLLIGVLVAGALSGAAVAEGIGLHPAIGAFLFGAITPQDDPALARTLSTLQSFTVTVLLPLFFASIGLRVSVGLLGNSVRRWLIFGLLLAIACISKLIGGYLGARVAKLSVPDSLTFAALMNCRGVTELAVASIGFQQHLIGRLGLTMLVLIAVLTTTTTGPLLRLVRVAEAGGRFAGRPKPEPGSYAQGNLQTPR